MGKPKSRAVEEQRGCLLGSPELPLARYRLLPRHPNLAQVAAACPRKNGLILVCNIGGSLTPTGARVDRKAAPCVGRRPRAPWLCTQGWGCWAAVPGTVGPPFARP